MGIGGALVVRCKERERTLRASPDGKRGDFSGLVMSIVVGCVELRRRRNAPPIVTYWR